MWSEQTRQLIETACAEDLGTGDISAGLLADAGAAVTGRIVVRQAGVVCGLAVAPAVCAEFAGRVGQPLGFTPAQAGGRPIQDGDPVGRGTCVAGLGGPRAAVLAAERTLLNFLGRMSGVATLTRQFVEAARRGNPSVQVLDTRKTIPGWRELDKYAVRAGGGRNHRLGLYDAVLIKDNHLAGIPTARLAEELAALLKRVRGRPAFVEVEVDRLEQLDEVCKVAGIDVVLLDNFALEDMRAAVARRDARGLRGKPALEASGGVTLANVAAIAATGVERIAVGALTHSAASLDIGLDC